MGRARATNPPSDPTVGLAFLLSQVGAHAAAVFADRLAPLNLTPPHAGILRVIRQANGLSQQALGEKLGMFPSRLVALLDELEQRGLVERRDNPADRRSYALHLTRAGASHASRSGGSARPPGCALRRPRRVGTGAAHQFSHADRGPAAAHARHPSGFSQARRLGRVKLRKAEFVGVVLAGRPLDPVPGPCENCRWANPSEAVGVDDGENDP